MSDNVTIPEASAILPDDDDWNERTGYVNVEY
jgi:hypothetical protein